ncbi:MAG TPA: hydrogenase 4 subunit B [Acetobacteraceae bacterium]|nr:hydrogenase 4 subunit B [Acetobacteraceae bacterium]
MIIPTLLCPLLLCAIGIAAAASFAGEACRRERVLPAIYGASALLCALIAVLALASLGAAPSTITLPLGLPWVGARFRLDALSAFFLFVAGLGGAGASVYAIGYGRHETAPHRVLPFYPVFLAGLFLVLLADDAFTFLFDWELMSLASWALVIAHHRDPANTYAGYVYLLMAAFSGFTLLLAFGLLSGGTGGYSFDAMRAAHPSAVLAAPVLLLALLGAGSKAGLMPLHAWLPLAHPAAPSHVSALMSGVMTKVAVYAFIRIIFDLLGTTPWWTAVIVLALGGATAVLGVLYALMQHDLKRLLAYHTVENIGIIFIGLGLAMAFRANGFAAGAALALTAALFHVFNHAVFKSLLFFGAGAVLTATGERDMEHLGGLIHRMRISSFAFLVGCAAISALPPLNGFVSEWLTFQAILLRPDLPQWGLKIAIPADGALLALAAALAAACFVKAYGVTFLGRPRTAAAANAQDVDRFSLGTMLVFAAICLLAGMFPGAVIDMLAPVSTALLQARMPTQLGLPWETIIPIAASRSSYNGLLIFAFIASSTGIAVWAIHRFASHAVRRGPAWDCGFPDPSPITQYSADSFAQPIRRVFGASVFRSRETILMPPPGDLRPARIEKFSRDLIWDVCYAPVGTAVATAAQALNRLQFLTIRRYLAFVFLALIALLLALALWQ